MKRLLLAALCVHGFSISAHTPNGDEGFPLCESLLGRESDAQFPLEKFLEVLDHDPEARRLYTSHVAGTNLIVLVSRGREARDQAARALLGSLGLHGFVPGIYADRFLSAGWTAHPEMFRADSLIEPRNLGAQAAFAPRAEAGHLDSVMLLEKMGRLTPDIWRDGTGRFLSYIDLATREQTTRAMSSTLMLGLVPSEVAYDEWTDNPLGTLLKAVKAESVSFDLDDWARERLAAIYYVGRPQEIWLESQSKFY